MNPQEVRVEVSADRSIANVTFLSDTGSAGTIRSNENGLLGFIHSFSAARQAMLEGKPRQKLEGQVVPTVVNPPWHVQPAMACEATAFTFDHPAFGPISFVVPMDQVDQMVKLLTRHVALAKEAKNRRPC